MAGLPINMLILTLLDKCRTMTMLWLTAVAVVALSSVAAAQTIGQLVPGFQATKGFTVSTDITTLSASGQFVTVSS